MTGMRTAGSPQALGPAGGGLRRRVRLARSFVRGVIGADAYEVYLEHQGRVHPGEPVMTAREFWRDQTDRQAKNPQTRCC